VTDATLNAHKLARLLDSTAPHMADSALIPQIHGIRLDCDGRTLHAVATDRYTLAVARAGLRQPTDPFALTLPAADLPYLRAWTNAHHGHEFIRITPDLTPDRARAVFTDDRDHGTASTMAFPVAAGAFPDWRPLLHTALAAELDTARQTAIDTRLLERWTTAGDTVTIRQTTGLRPLVITAGPDFIGFQMPMRPLREAPDHTDVVTSWTGTGHPRVEMVAPPTAVLPDEIARLLKRTLRADIDLVTAGDRDEDRTRFDYALTRGIDSWTSYRLLDALRIADPDLAERTLRDLHDQLESDEIGEIGELAHDAATGEGLDPNAWIEEFLSTTTATG
jgi:hypothetical protein